MKYILYGAGKYGKDALNYFGNGSVILFVDKNRKECIENIKVISPEELIRRGVQEDEIVVITPRGQRDVASIVVFLNENKIPFAVFDEVANEIIIKEAQVFSKDNKRETFKYNKEYEYFFPMDRLENAGVIGSYFWQDLWAAKKIYEKKPTLHYDIGSRVDGFITHLLSFQQKVRLIDVRPLSIDIDNLDFIQADATNLNSIEDESVESLSALCSLEHFGMGRYGDPIDPEACFKCFDAIQKKIKKGGLVYISVPIGKEHIEFNAHRVFYAETIVKAFNKLKLLEFSSCYNDKFEHQIDIHSYDEDTTKGGNRFGLFMFIKE